MAAFCNREECISFTAKSENKLDKCLIELLQITVFKLKSYKNKLYDP